MLWNYIYTCSVDCGSYPSSTETVLIETLSGTKLTLANCTSWAKQQGQRWDQTWLLTDTLPKLQTQKLATWPGNYSEVAVFRYRHGSITSMTAHSHSQRTFSHKRKTASWYGAAACWQYAPSFGGSGALWLVIGLMDKGNWTDYRPWALYVLGERCYESLNIYSCIHCWTQDFRCIISLRLTTANCL